MKVIFLFVAIISTVFGAAIPEYEGRNGLAELLKARGGLELLLNDRIVGGQPADIESFPFIVSMQRFGSHRCGGSIISTNRILTAAHCTVGISASSLTIRAGSTLSQSGGQTRPVSRIINHPNFNGNTLNNDVSVMILQSPLTLGVAVRVISISNTNDYVSAGSISTVAGWGAERENWPASPILRSVSKPVVSNSDCNALYFGGITDVMLCAGYLEGGRDTCQGDSGGPLIVDYVQVGIVSWGNGCARPRFPGVYARVSALRSWIDSAV